MNARVERLIENGRIFIAGGRDVQDVVAFLTDADIEFTCRHTSRGGWIISL